VPLRAPSPVPPAAPGQHITAVIRPDSFDIRRLGGGPAAADGAVPNDVTGEVTDVRFIGPLVHYLVAVADRKWQVSARAGGTEILPEGTAVRLTWRPDEVIVLPDSANRTE
jgi:ABC-type Fe3+/spermidine/putrescine transport system ATPase subunit